jgi:DNA-binding Lrp family transcriptional regulator
MLDEYDRKIINLVQKIPICSRPYKAIAEKVGLTESGVIERIKDYKRKGMIRRMGAAIDHFLSGFDANAMVVWKVKPSEVERVGKALSSYDVVTHCYERKTCKDWVYNIFTVFHARSREELDQTVESVAEEIGVFDYQVLYTIKELKKDGVKYL